MTELKPCPFCGGEAETLTAESMYGGYLFGIMCNDCLSRGDVYDTEAEAVEAWNTRHVETCRIERNERSNNLRLYTLSCGHTVWTMGYTPDYCVTCGRKVEQ